MTALDKVGATMVSVCVVLVTLDLIVVSRNVPMTALGMASVVQTSLVNALMVTLALIAH